MKFEIKRIASGELIFSIETDSFKLAVEAAVRMKVDLRSANLSFANLRSADLSSADFSSANLRFADLRFANLSSANIDEKKLRIFRDDIWAVLSSSPLEVSGLR